MCGIAAVFNSNPFAATGNTRQALAPYKQKALLNDMLLASAVRGTDGTGLYQMGAGAEVLYDKMALPSAYALEMDGVKSIVDEVHNASITVGHVRAATQGDVNDDNCHPFIAGREDSSYIIGVHNGTLYGWDTPATEHKVDSAWAFSMLAKEGTDVLSEFYGAFTLVWYDSREPGKVFIARNEERPFHLVRSNDGKSMYAASEAGMLTWLLDKHNLSVEEDVYSLDTGVIACIDTTKSTLRVEKVGEFDDAYAQYKKYTSTTNKTNAKQGASCPLPAPTTSYTSAPSSIKTYMVEAVKDCLRRARTSLYFTDDDGPVEMGPVDDGPYIRAKESWYTTKGIDSADMSRAMREGLYGRVVHFDAVEYDSFLDNIVGEIVSPTNLNSPVAYMNDVSDEEAALIVDTQVAAVVVGARHFGNEVEYIVTPLTEEGRQELAA